MSVGQNEVSAERSEPASQQGWSMSRKLASAEQQVESLTSSLAAAEKQVESLTNSLDGAHVLTLSLSVPVFLTRPMASLANCTLVHLPPVSCHQHAKRSWPISKIGWIVTTR